MTAPPAAPPGLPTPPADLPPARRCEIHAACRGDAPGLAAELSERQARLDSLGRALGRPVAPPAPAPPARARASFRALPDGHLAQALPGTHDLRPVGWCGLLHPRLADALAAMPPLPPELAQAELRTDGARVVLAAQASRPRFAKALGTALRALDLPVDGLAVDGRAVQGDATLSLSAGGVTHQVGPEAFTQVHLEVNRQLVGAVQQAVADLVGRVPGALRGVAVLDLYAGYGNLGLPLCLQGATLTMLESNPAACKDARRTAAALGLTVDVRQGDAGAFRAGDAFYDVAVLDPPRAGADRLLSQVIVTRPQGIVFVSCNPGHLGRDLRPALQAGYRLESVQAFDMFPLTPHVEVLAVLRRG